MKTRHLTQTLAIAAVAAFASLTLNAAEPLLSPRATDRQIRIVAGTTKDHIDRSFKGSPKAESLKTRMVSGVTQDHANRSAQLVSPRVLEHAPLLAHANGGK